MYGSLQYLALKKMIFGCFFFFCTTWPTTYYYLVADKYFATLLKQHENHSQGRERNSAKIRPLERPVLIRIETSWMGFV